MSFHYLEPQFPCAFLSNNWYLPTYSWDLHIKETKVTRCLYLAVVYDTNLCSLLHFCCNLERLWWAEAPLWGVVAIFLNSFSEPEQCMWLGELWAWEGWNRVCSVLTPLAEQRKGVDVGRSHSSAPLPSMRWSPEGRNSNDVWPSKGCSRLLPPSSWTLWGTWGLTICQPGTLVRGSKHPGFIGLLKQRCARCYFSVMQQDFWLFFFLLVFPIVQELQHLSGYTFI